MIIVCEFVTTARILIRSLTRSYFSMTPKNAKNYLFSDYQSFKMNFIKHPFFQMKEKYNPGFKILNTEEEFPNVQLYLIVYCKNQNFNLNVRFIVSKNGLIQVIDLIYKFCFYFFKFLPNTVPQKAFTLKRKNENER
ncbi:hypothetical protein BpHYR1_050985 [Brachionus plicatilis]|uniref:Uncharacterized protein n=1 Tax=Brachionus plicatilis TaxID=10195 RepID=A0A3M7QXG7_BRAPC|nr:hypothetical protein BpHYR1_050985 [Brachionus plicatilis]